MAQDNNRTIRIWKNKSDMPGYLNMLLDPIQKIKNIQKFLWISYIPFEIYKESDIPFTQCSHFGEHISTIQTDFGILRFAFVPAPIYLLKIPKKNI